MNKQVTIIYIFLSVAALLSQNLKAQVFCFNNTDKDLWLAFAYNFVPNSANIQTLNQDYWVSEGWFFIPPKGTTQLNSHIGFDRENGTKTNFFFYATHQNGRDYSGNRFFLIDNNAEFNAKNLSFRIEKANSKLNYPDINNLQMRAFRPITIQTDGQYTLIINGNEVNDEPLIHDIENEESYFK